MYRFGRRFLILAFGASVLAVGIPYWLIPYRQVSLPNTLMTPALLIVVIAAAVASGFRITSFWKNVGTLGASIPAAVMLRVTVETTADPTSHNLWPFEIVIALMLGMACAFCGGALGALLARLAAQRA